MPKLFEVSTLYLHQVKLIRSEATYKNYMYVVKELQAYFGDIRIKTISESRFMEFISAKSESVSPGTIRAIMTRTRTFFGWCRKHGYLEKNIVADLELPRPTKKSEHERAISQDDLNKLLRYAYTRNERDFAFIMMLASTGARMSAIVGLRLADLNLQARTASAIEKGNEPVTIRYDRPTVFALKRYLDVRPTPRPFHDFVWCNLNHEGHQAIKYTGANAMLKRYGRAAGCSKPVSGHQFRHKIGQDWSRRPDVSPVDTQKKLNHKNFWTTYHYYYADQSDKLRDLTDSYDFLPDDIQDELCTQDTPLNIIKFPFLDDL